MRRPFHLLLAAVSALALTGSAAAGLAGASSNPDVPPEAAAAMASIVRTGSNNTNRLMPVITSLREAGVDESLITQYAYGRFPIAGPARYSHDWWFPRHVPTFHLHEGTDVFADAGTPVRSPFDGVVRLTRTSIGGNNVYVTRADGTYVYLAHLGGFADGMADGVRVSTGDVVGFVGTSGNAKGTPPHVHLELHPFGGEPIDPKPYLDQWLAEAEQLAREMTVTHAGTAVLGRQVHAAPAAPVARTATPRARLGLTALRPGGHDQFSAPPVAPTVVDSWLGASSPAGVIGIAEAAARAALAD